MPPVRCSALQLAEACPASARLAEEHPSVSAYATAGTAGHAEIAAALKGQRRPEHAGMAAACGHVMARKLANPNALIWVEERVSLQDPETGEELTAGTPDVAIVDDAVVTIVDWKFGQVENVEAVDTNLQLHAYALAWALRLQARAYRLALVFVRDDDIIIRPSRDFVPQDWWEPIERIRRINQGDPKKAIVGPHCDDCYARRWCAAWMLPAHEGPSAIEQFTRPGGIVDNETALRALRTKEVFKKAVDVMEPLLKDYVREHGAITDGDRTWAASPQVISEHMVKAHTKLSHRWRKEK